MLSRRILLAGLAAAAVARTAHARNSPPIIGFVGFASPDADRPLLMAFRAGLQALGYELGRNVIFETHSVHGDVAKGTDVIADLARRPVDVFLSLGQAATRAIVRHSRIPVVAIGLPTEPGAEGLFASLAKPGGSVTGFSSFGEELSAKRIEVLRQIAPQVTSVGVIHNALDVTFANWGNQTIEDLRRQGLRPIRLPLSSASPTEVSRLMDELKAEGGQAVVVVRDFLTTTLVKDVCHAASKANIIVVGEHRQQAEAGALFTYGPDLPELFRKAAEYVDRILKGEQAGNLPIQLPTKFEFVVNAQTARILDLQISQAVLVRADEVID